MSPVGGVGINYAIQDAVEAANLLADPLMARPGYKRTIWRRAAPPRVADARHSMAAKTGSSSASSPAALRSNAPLNLPLAIRLLLRLPLLRNLPARMIAFGVRRVHVKR